MATVVERKVHGDLIAAIYAQFVTTSLLLGLWLVALPTMGHAADPPAPLPDEPSLDDTLDWLVTKVEGAIAIDNMENTFIIRVFNLERDQNDRCQLALKQQWRSGGIHGPKISNDSMMNIPLSALGANTVTVSGADKPNTSSTVTASCVKGSCVSGLSRTTKADTTEWEDWKYVEHSSVSIAFTEESLAKRVQSALTHAIVLCGGQKEPF